MKKSDRRLTLSRHSVKVLASSDLLYLAAGTTRPSLPGTDASGPINTANPSQTNGQCAPVPSWTHVPVVCTGPNTRTPCPG